MSRQHGDWAETVTELLALAQRLEGHGQYNLVKLSRAAADALLRRAAYHLNLPDDSAANAADLLALSGRLAELGLNEAFAQRLARGVQAMSAGRLPLLDEIPNPFVCRNCGELVLERPSAPCPVCEAWPTTFQEFLPVYWLNESEPGPALVRLEAAPGIVGALVAGLSDEQLNRPGTDGGWSIRHVVSHLRDAEGVLSFRVRRMMEHDDPTLESLAVFEWANTEEAQPPRVAEILQAYAESRAGTVAFLAALSADDWGRNGQHTEFGEVTIRQQASYFAAHEQTHFASLATLRKAHLR